MTSLYLIFVGGGELIGEEDYLVFYFIPMKGEEQKKGSSTHDSSHEHRRRKTFISSILCLGHVLLILKENSFVHLGLFEENNPFSHSCQFIGKQHQWIVITLLSSTSHFS